MKLISKKATAWIGFYMSTTEFKNHVLFSDYKTVKEICAPLKKINTYGCIFMRHFLNATFVDLSNQLEWSDFFMQRYMQEKYPKEMLQDHMMISEGISLWSLNQDNVIWQEGEHEFGFGHGITIVNSHRNFTDIFCFYTRKDQDQMDEFYVKNIHLLRKFTDYFLEQAKSIIQKGTSNPLHVPPQYQEQVPKKSQEITAELLNEFLCEIDDGYKRYTRCAKLSERELMCINHCASGQSAKQVADKLFISVRTVESHLNNAKLKLNCANLSELISIVIRYYEQR